MSMLRLQYDGFDWDDGNIKKAQKHGLSIQEIESLFLEELLVLDDGKHSWTEHRTIAVGKLKNQRTAFVVFTIRKLKGLRLVRVISSRYMHKKEKIAYEELRKRLEKLD